MICNYVFLIFHVRVGIRKFYVGLAKIKLFDIIVELH